MDSPVSQNQQYLVLTLLLHLLDVAQELLKQGTEECRSRQVNLEQRFPVGCQNVLYS